MIAPSALTDFAPLYSEGGGDGVVTQFDKDDVEAIGLVKFDFLGLRTLTIIDWAVKAINARRARAGEAPLDITLLPLDDRWRVCVAEKGADRRRVPARIARHAGHAQGRAAGPLRGHHRAGLAVSAPARWT